MIELDPRYCDVIIKRSETLVGGTATLAEMGLPFDAVAEGRAADDRDGAGPDGTEVTSPDDGDV